MGRGGIRGNVKHNEEAVGCGGGEMGEVWQAIATRESNRIIWYRNGGTLTDRSVCGLGLLQSTQLYEFNQVNQLLLLLLLLCRLS